MTNNNTFYDRVKNSYGIDIKKELTKIADIHKKKGTPIQNIISEDKFKNIPGRGFASTSECFIEILTNMAKTVKVVIDPINVDVIIDMDGIIYIMTAIPEIKLHKLGKLKNAFLGDMMNSTLGSVVVSSAILSKYIEDKKIHIERASTSVDNLINLAKDLTNNQTGTSFALCEDVTIDGFSGIEEFMPIIAGIATFNYKYVNTDGFIYVVIYPEDADIYTLIFDIAKLNIKKVDSMMDLEHMGTSKSNNIMITLLDAGFVVVHGDGTSGRIDILEEDITKVYKTLIEKDKSVEHTYNELTLKARVLHVYSDECNKSLSSIKIFKADTLANCDILLIDTYAFTDVAIYALIDGKKHEIKLTIKDDGYEVNILNGEDFETVGCTIVSGVEINSLFLMLALYKLEFPNTIYI